MKTVLIASTLVLVLVGAAKADLMSIERYTYTYITPGAANFAGSSFVYNNTINFNIDSGTLTTTLNFQPVATGINIYGQGTTTVSPSSLPDHTLSTLETIMSPGGTVEGYGFDYAGLASAVPGQSFLTYGTIGGQAALTFSGGGTNLLDNGGRFITFAVITGDYSGAGTHTAATFAPGYTLVSDFVFDAAGDTTTVAVETRDYEGTNPSLSFSLLGTPVVTVPEPASLALVALGLAGLAGMRRRSPACG